MRQSADVADSQAGANALVLGVTPFFSPRRIIEIYGPAVASFSQTLGRNVRLRTAANFSKFARQLEQESFDIAVLQPFDYHNATINHHYLPLARVDEQLLTAFVTRADSPLTSLADLKGKKVAMPPPPTANARMGLAELVKAGLDPKKDLTILYVASHDSCLHEVQIGNAAVCTTARPIIELFASRMKTKLKVLATTPPLPHILFVVHQRVPARQRELLQKQIIAWRNNVEGRKILRGMRFPGFTVAEDADYQPMLAFNALLAGQGLAGLAPATDHQQTGVLNNAKPQLLFGSFPYVNPKKLVDLLAPMTKRFATVLPANIQFRTTVDYAKFVTNVSAGYYDIVLVQPYDLSTALAAGYQPLARMKGTIKAAVYVKASSSYRSLPDLKGQAIAAPPRDAAVSHLFLRLLRQQGLKEGRDVFVSFLRSHHACMEHLQLDLVEACATAPIILKGLMLPQNLATDVRRVAISEGIPGVVLLAGERVSQANKQSLQKEILNWQETEYGRSLLKSAGFRPFVTVLLSDYQGLRPISVE